MAESTSASCIKWILNIMNLIFFILGLAMLGVGGYIYHQVNNFSDVASDTFQGIAIFILCLGAFIFLLSFFGYFGTLKENVCMTTTYSVILLVLFLLELSAAIYGFVQKDEVSNSIKTFAFDAMDSWNETAIQNSWNTIQKSFDCCGVDHYRDWSNATGHGETFLTWASANGWDPNGTTLNTEYPVPDSCCVTAAENCGLSYNVKNATDALRPAGSDQGCADGVANWLIDHIGMIAGLAAGIAVLELIGVVFACYLVKSEGGFSAYGYYA
ncbi:Oidioi.mRNA.OKI2018_I69.chr1.g3889.t1.cds [Oikopleura dioica]|uniref:Tetraspanin n=1 Tax=Oikopleura dioica TaxID=34765 RepID=A0ABN7SW37_OIKDI|nr:Oidioi.mRNA.OKI2018_I69.chr1.g3889.t1.cds [Oikopleura dioica]